MNNLLAAIMNKCSGSALATYVGSRIFLDEAPEGSAYPYVVFRIIAGVPQDTFKNTIEDALIEFSLFSVSDSATEITTMYSNLKSLFDWQPLTISENTCIWSMRQGLSTMFDDVTTKAGTVGVRHWSVGYSIMLQARSSSPSASVSASSSASPSM